MRLIFSFDTEDYVTPEAWDAQKWWAEQLTARGVRGSFQCVGELVRRLKARGRQDVLEALARHEIGYHGNLHSAPPIHCVAVDGLSLADGVAWILRREAAGYAQHRGDLRPRARQRGHERGLVDARRLPGDGVDGHAASMRAPAAR